MSVISHNISSNTSTYEIQQTTCRYCYGVFILLICLEIIILILQCIGNGLVIWTVAATPSLRTTCMIFICNLAIADFLNALFVIPIAILLEVYILIKRKVLLFWLDLSFAFGYTFYTVAMVNLAFMSIDRSMAIVQPMKYKVFMTTKKVNFLLLGTWLAGIVIGIWEGMKLFPRQGCFYATIIFIAIVYLIIMISFAVLLGKLKSQDRVRASMVSTSTQMNNAQRKRDQKLAKTVSLVIGVFTVSWCLLAYTMLFPPLDLASSLLGTWGQFFLWGVCLSFTSTAIDPFIYFFQSSPMKAAAKSLISRKILCRS